MLKKLFWGSTDFTEAIFKIPQISKHFSAMLETGQLHMFGKNDTITAVKNILRKRYEDKFFYEIRNSSKLGLYSCIKEKFATE